MKWQLVLRIFANQVRRRNCEYCTCDASDEGNLPPVLVPVDLGPAMKMVLLHGDGSLVSNVQVQLRVSRSHCADSTSD